VFTRIVREFQSVHAVSAGLDTEFVGTRPYLRYSFEDVVVQIQSNVVFFDELVFDSVVEPKLSFSFSEDLIWLGLGPSSLFLF
jgi:hypothetical protein